MAVKLEVLYIYMVTGWKQCSHVLKNCLLDYLAYPKWDHNLQNEHQVLLGNVMTEIIH